MKQAGKVDALGKNRNEASEGQDYAKKQSKAQPATENLDMQPNSVEKTDTEKKEHKNLHEKANQYADKEHKKAASWEDHSALEDDK